MMRVHLVLFVGLCAIGLVCADCYFKEDFICKAGDMATEDCYNCNCLGNGFAQCCRMSSAMKPGYPKTCQAIFRKKSCSWKIVDKDNKRKPCDFNTGGYVVG